MAGIMIEVSQECLWGFLGFTFAECSLLYHCHPTGMLLTVPACRHWAIRNGRVHHTYNSCFIRNNYWYIWNTLISAALVRYSKLVNMILGKWKTWISVTDRGVHGFTYITCICRQNRNTFISCCNDVTSFFSILNMIKFSYPSFFLSAFGVALGHRFPVCET